MSEWDARIREHRVWDEMRLLGPVIDTAVGTEGIEPEAFAGLERIRAILSFCGKRFAAADPLIGVLGPLDAAASGFEGARAAVELFASDTDIAHILTANEHADQALIGANQIPVASSPEELGALVSSATEYRILAEERLSASKVATDEFRTETENLRTGLGGLTVSLQAEQEKLTQIVTEYQRQFSDAQETRGQEFSEALRRSQAGLATVVSDHQGQFSAAQDTRGAEFAEAQSSRGSDFADAQDSRGSEFAEAQDARGSDFVEAQSTRQEKFNELVIDYSQRLADQDAELTQKGAELMRVSAERIASISAEYEEKAKGILGAIEEEKKRIEKLVGVIGNLGVTSGYLRAANHARKSMWFWQTMTVAAMVVLSVLAFRTLPLLEDSKGQFNWGGFAGRVLLLASLGVIAAYSGSQADKLFDVEKRNRKLALELEAIGPYLAPLPDDEQAKFRIQIGHRSFGRDEDRGPVASRKSPATLFGLLKSKEGKEVIDLIMDIARKGKGV
jgi:hypothetical protein